MNDLQENICKENYLFASFTGGNWVTGFTVDTSTGIFTKVGHGFVENSLIELNPGTGVLPTGFSSYDTLDQYGFGKYYKITVVSTDTFTLTDPLTGNVVVPSSTGVGLWSLRSGVSTISVNVPPLSIVDSIKILFEVRLAKSGAGSPIMGVLFNNNITDYVGSSRTKLGIAPVNGGVSFDMRLFLTLNVVRDSNGLYRAVAEFYGIGTNPSGVLPLFASSTPYAGGFIKNEDLSSVQFTASYPCIRSSSVSMQKF